MILISVIIKTRFILNCITSGSFRFPFKALTCIASTYEYETKIVYNTIDLKLIDGRFDGVQDMIKENGGLSIFEIMR